MKRNTIYLAALGFLFLGISCVEEQNFDQADDLEVIPTVATSIFYFESTEAIINLAPEGAFYSQVFSFEAFSQDFVADQVLDGTITYQVENTTSKELDITIEFLDAAGNVLDVETFTIPPEPTPLLERQIVYGPTGRNLDILINTSNIRVTGINQGDSTSQSSVPQPSIILRSSAVFRVQLL